jgi:uncharacterized protein YoxC
MDLLVAIKVAAFLALIAFIVLAIFMMISLGSVTKLLKEANSNLNTLSRKLVLSLDEIKSELISLNVKTQETLGNIDVVANNLGDTAQRIDSETEKLSRTLQPFQNLIAQSYNRIAPPVENATRSISAVSKAVSTFFTYIGNSKKK